MYTDWRLALSLAGLLAAGCGVAASLPRFPAQLAGHAILPAATFVAAPPEAPAEFALSGRYAARAGQRIELPESVPALNGSGASARPTGLALPFRGQPVQGISGLAPAGDGAWWAIADNGFGNRANSADALLMLHRLHIDWAAGTVAREATLFLSDPLRRMPWPIALEHSAHRLLTGADLDPESLVALDDGFWIGDEFGPFLVRVDRLGRVQQVVEARAGARTLRSPNHPAVRDTPGAAHAAVGDSAGFEGLALAADRRRLYAMLERPLATADGAREPFLRVLEFDLGRGDWSGRTLRYTPDARASAIGDLTFVDARRALVIERDHGEGDATLACARGATPPGCFPAPARYKRLVLVELPDGDGELRRIGDIDLLDIHDPKRRARAHGDRAPGDAQRFALPFVTIESVRVVGDSHVLIANDNNLPFSAGRRLERADDTEFVLLYVPELLRAR
jgi:hypothetical protein